MDAVQPPLVGTVAIVTGGGKGIGRSVALGLHRAGAQVVATARNQSDLDAADPSAVAATVRMALREFGRIDLPVNNAAISDGEEGVAVGQRRGPLVAGGDGQAARPDAVHPRGRAGDDRAG